jgi:hypothetical protein
VEPPYDPEWPEATCDKWANETDECVEDWFAEYCDLSCGRCTSSGTGGTTGTGGVGSGGTGGASSGGTGGSSTCTDVAPPYDPSWPDATCEKWANETAECAQEWFADYCDLSCGRCTSSGTGGTSGTGGVSSGGTSGTGGVSSGGTSGTGGVSSGGTGGASSCTNVSPPYDPNWPDATCDKWANETDECEADWFADYCDQSCGRCTGSGTGGSSGAGGTSSGGAGGTSSGGTGGTSSGGTGGGSTLPNIPNGQNGWASRYWDCCKPHCAWPGNGGTEAVCAANGTSHMSSDTPSACGSTGNVGYVCSSDAPRAVSSTVSYGYVAVPSPQCGACYHIQFTGTSHNAGNDPGSAAISGKHMIVRVSNTGGDVASNQFDLMIPGGGMGLNPNTCPQQWGVSAGDMGAPNGGFLSSCTGDHAARKACVRNKCNTIVPAGQLRDSCNWFVDWFEIADNPNFKVEPIACPSDI